MSIELKSDDHGLAQAEDPRDLVGRRRKTKGLMAGAMTARPMSADAERRFKAALQRVVADIVEVHLRGQEGKVQ